ncbi:glycosyltransferase [Enterococcus mundtii]|uniref:Glycosyl transferase n=1 Tax=Enterococcus mundtii TaxID=53346 RepID=A0ABQ0VGH3_ENTMU|nr:glycosyltransferase family 4 protein [Enterococcus mundtii]GEN17517.1 glycosyl transferase [Ligilactobacillus acidipiscis]AUB51771.1 hypothetical protein EM4838_01755 [Enterococcus mundtii]MDB7087608.1 glycosyltransferase family 4 protein [Enterococcus mundtii]MZZ58825.1 glycosyltransferase [Enterococcus mundtii]MZZ61659.1 glycosyltransferase [Enterococcus mundtii]
MGAEKKKRVLFVSGSNKPVPATSGGAIEFLTQKLWELNKKKPMDVDFFVLSCSSVYSDDPSMGLFYYKDAPTIFQKAKRYLDKCTNQINRYQQKYTLINPNLLSKLKILVGSYSFDEIIMLNYGVYCPKIREFYVGKLSLYLHNDYLNRFSFQKSKILQSVDRIISVSSFIDHRVKEVLNQSNTPTLCVVENGIDTTAYSPVTNDTKICLREKLGISHQKKVVLFSGRIDRSKGITYLMDAIEQLTNEQVLLLVVGTVSNKQLDKALRHSAIDWKLIEQVTQEEMPIYYQVADLCVIPSIVKESFCLVNMEAQACGLPVITTDAGALNDYFFGDEQLQVAADPKTLSTDLVKAMTYFFKNEQAIEKFDYRQHAENYSLEKMYQTMISEVRK